MTEEYPASPYIRAACQGRVAKRPCKYVIEHQDPEEVERAMAEHQRHHALLTSFKITHVAVEAAPDADR